MLDRWLADGARRVPMRSVTTVLTTAAVGAAVAAGVAKPVTVMGFEGVTVDPQKASVVVVVSEELAKSRLRGAVTLEAELRAAVGAASDLVIVARSRPPRTP